jgi:Cys-rich repeat protein
MRRSHRSRYAGILGLLACTTLIASDGPRFCSDGTNDEVIIGSTGDILNNGDSYPGTTFTPVVWEDLTVEFDEPLGGTLATDSCGGPSDPGGPCPEFPLPFVFRADSVPGAPGTFTIEARSDPGAHGFRVDWAAATDASGSDLPALDLSIAGTWAANAVPSSPAGKPSVAIIRAYEISWGAAASQSSCTLALHPPSGADIIVPTDGTPLRLEFNGPPFVTIPFTLEHACTFTLPDDCSGAPPGSSCVPLDQAGQAAGAFVVELTQPFARCTSSRDCGVDSPFCVNRECTTGDEGARCQHAGHCDAGLLCGPDFQCHRGDATDPCDAPFDCPHARDCVLARCSAGELGDSCSVDSGCAPTAPFCTIQKGAAAGQCARGGLRGSCSEDADCSGGLRCLGPLFQETCLECGSSSDCGAGEVCFAGVCSDSPRPTCSSTTDCPAGLRCTFLGIGQPQRCLYNCFTTNPCAAEAPRCEGDRCLACLVDADCALFERCDAERCVPAP